MYVSAADIYWAPYLERLAAHVPALHSELKPRSGRFEALTDWFDAMDELVSAYSRRVKGRPSTWQQVCTALHVSEAVLHSLQTGGCGGIGRCSYVGARA